MHWKLDTTTGSYVLQHRRYGDIGCMTQISDIHWELELSIDELELYESFTTEGNFELAQQSFYLLANQFLTKLINQLVALNEDLNQEAKTTNTFGTW